MVSGEGDMQRRTLSVDRAADERKEKRYKKPKGSRVKLSLHSTVIILLLALAS